MHFLKRIFLTYSDEINGKTLTLKMTPSQPELIHATILRHTSSWSHVALSLSPSPSSIPSRLPLLQVRVCCWPTGTLCVPWCFRRCQRTARTSRSRPCGSSLLWDSRPVDSTETPVHTVCLHLQNHQMLPSLRQGVNKDWGPVTATEVALTGLLQSKEFEANGT